MYYFRKYPKDSVRLKALVVALWLLDTIRTILGIWCNWKWTIPIHANLQGSLGVSLSFVTDFFFEGMTILIVQIYFIGCIWRLLAVDGKRYQSPAAAIVGIVCLASFACCIATVYNIQRTLDVTTAIRESTASGCAHILLAVIADIYIAISLVLILRRRKTGFNSTNNLVSGLMLYTIHRGIAIALVQFLEVALFAACLHAKPFKLLWLLCHYSGSKVYVNSLLALLNLRDHLRFGSRVVNVESNILLSIRDEGVEAPRDPAYVMTARDTRQGEYSDQHLPSGCVLVDVVGKEETLVTCS